MKKTQVSILLLLFGCFCLGAGWLRGENSVILAKAIRICLECVGIG